MAHLAFRSVLLERFEEVSAAAERKLGAAAETVRLLEALETLEKARAASLERLAQRLPAALPAESTGVARLWACELRWLAAAARTAADGAQDVRRLRERLATALDAAEAARRRLTGEGHAAAKRLAESAHALAKARDRYHRACRDSDAADAAAEAERRRAKATPSSLDAAEKRAGRACSEVAACEGAYRAQIAAANDALDEHFSATLPRLLDGFQALFAQRCSDLAGAGTALAQLLRSQHEGVEAQIRVAEDAAAALSPDAENDEFAAKLRTGFVGPQLFEFEPPPTAATTATSPSSLLSGSSSGSGTTPVLARKAPLLASAGAAIAAAFQPAPPQQSRTALPPNAVFGVTLQELMDRQQDKHPGDCVPHCLKAMAEGVLHLGAERTSGVFRVPGARTEIDSCREAMDINGEPFVLPRDVIDAAGLLKTWLHALPGPVVPEDFYEAAIALSETKDDPEGAAVAVLERIPEPNRSTLRYVVQFLKHLSREEVAAVTLMPRDNLASVFAPCLLDCPYKGDFRKTLAAADKERAFISSLIIALPHDPSFAALGTTRDIPPPPLPLDIPPPPQPLAPEIDIPPPSAVDIPPPPLPIADGNPQSTFTVVPPAPQRVAPAPPVKQPPPPPPSAPKPLRNRSGPLKVPSMLIPSDSASSSEHSSPLSDRSSRSSRKGSLSHSHHRRRPHGSKGHHSHKKGSGATPLDSDLSDADTPSTSAAARSSSSSPMPESASSESEDDLPCSTFTVLIPSPLAEKTEKKEEATTAVDIGPPATTAPPAEETEKKEDTEKKEEATTADIGPPATTAPPAEEPEKEEDTEKKEEATTAVDIGPPTTAPPAEETEKEKEGAEKKEATSVDIGPPTTTLPAEEAKKEEDTEKKEEEATTAVDIGPPTTTPPTEEPTLHRQEERTETIVLEAELENDEEPLPPLPNA